MNIKKLVLGATLALSAFALTGCGQGAGTATADSSLSGDLTIYLPAPAGLADNLIAEFSSQHPGVNVSHFQGTTGEILARLEAESANPIADVVILASWSDGMELERQGLLKEFTPNHADLLHPNFSNEANTMFGTSASAVGVAYNTQLFDSVNVDWSGLSDETFHDQLVFPDPEMAGSAKDFLGGFMYAMGEEEGWQTWGQLADNGMSIPGANAAALESVVTGERGVLVAGVDWNVFAAIDRGEPIGFFYPESGTVINPRPAMILNSTNNAENAQAFMNFLLSEEAQQMVVESFLIPGRSDIESDRRPNIDEITVLDTDWDWMVDHATAINTRFNNLFR